MKNNSDGINDVEKAALNRLNVLSSASESASQPAGVTVDMLASNVAHALNNPLTVILGLAQILMLEEGLTSAQREDLETICAQARRCGQIVEELKRYGWNYKPGNGTLEERRRAA